MSRAVITYPRALQGVPDLATARSGAPMPPEDKFKDRLLKYIPAEVVTLYLALTAIVNAASDVPSAVAWGIFLVGIVATPFYLRAILQVTDRTQHILSTLAFVVWVFALGGPFKDLAWYKPVYGGLLLPIFTFFAAGIKTAPINPSRN